MISCGNTMRRVSPQLVRKLRCQESPLSLLWEYDVWTGLRINTENFKICWEGLNVTSLPSFLIFSAVWTLRGYKLQAKCYSLYIIFSNTPIEYTQFTTLLTPWCRVLLEKLTGLQLVKKFPAFHGTGRFISALTSVRHLSLSWASPIQSIYPHPTSWRSILILSTHLRLGLPSGLFTSGFPTKILYSPPLLTHTHHMPSSSHSSRFYHPQNIAWGVQII